MTKQYPILELVEIAKHVPSHALRDINQRIRDHLASGGKDDDPYIYQQLRYAKRFVGLTDVKKTREPNVGDLRFKRFDGKCIESVKVLNCHDMSDEREIEIAFTDKTKMAINLNVSYYKGRVEDLEIDIGLTR